MIDYFISHLWQLWALISLLCLILELTNGDFFILCFAIGGVFAAVASAITDSLVVQILVFGGAYRAHRTRLADHPSRRLWPRSHRRRRLEGTRLRLASHRGRLESARGEHRLHNNHRRAGGRRAAVAARSAVFNNTLTL